MPRTICFATVLALSVWCGTANADSARVVLMVSAKASPMVKDTLNRAEAELRASGFEVVRANLTPSGETRMSLEAAALEHLATAAISLTAAANGASADIWVSERLTNKTLIRHIDVKDVAIDRRAFTLALRSVELLRASLVELQIKEQKRPDTESPPAAVVHLIGGDHRSPLQAFGMQLGLAAMLSIDGLKPTIAPLLRFSYAGDAGLGLRLGWLPPVVNNAHDGALGLAKVRQQLIQLEGFYAPSLDGARLVPIATTGIGIYHLSATGELIPPAVGVNPQIWSFSISAGGGALARINDTFGVALEVEGVLALPRPVVTMAGEEIGSAGMPSILTSLSATAQF